MRIAESNDLESFSEPVILDTPQNFEEGIEIFADAVEKISYGERPEKIVVGLPGILTENRHGLYLAPHLKGWEGQDIKKTLDEKLNTTTYLENDTALVGLGEAHSGAGVGFPILVYITISTGVGGVELLMAR
jgi:glucokinase